MTQCLLDQGQINIEGHQVRTQGMLQARGVACLRRQTKAHRVYSVPEALLRLTGCEPQSKLSLKNSVIFPQRRQAM